MFHWMLVDPQVLKSVLPVEDSFIRKCSRLVVSAHSLQVKHSTQVFEWEKQGQLLSTTSPLWFWRRIRIVVHFRDKFLSCLCCGTSYFKINFSSKCQKEPVSYFNQSSRIYSGILADQRVPKPISLTPVIASDNSSIVFFDNTCWRSSATALLVKLGLFSSLRKSKFATCSIFGPLTTGSAEMSPLNFTATVK